MKPNRSSLPIALVLTLLLAASLSMAAGVSSPQAPAVEPAEAEQPPAVGDQEQLFVPEPQAMGQCIECVGNYTTSQGWVTAASCAEAEQALLSQLSQEAGSFCQSIGANWYCERELDAVCYPAGGGQFKADGHLNHSCLEGDFFCPPG